MVTTIIFCTEKGCREWICTIHGDVTVGRVVCEVCWNRIKHAEKNEDKKTQIGDKVPPKK